MKIAIISDIHGNIHALSAVISDIKSQEIEKTIFLGDLVINGPAPLESYQEIRELNPFCWIKGNTDTWHEEIIGGWTPSSEQEEKLFRKYNFTRKYLSNDLLDEIGKYPTKKALDVEGFAILAVHGSPRSVSEGILQSISDVELSIILSEQNETIILSGHTHLPFIKLFKEKIIFNVGSIGLSLDGDNRASYGILEISHKTPECNIRRIEYPIEEAILLAQEREFPELDEYIHILRKAKAVY